MIPAQQLQLPVVFLNNKTLNKHIVEGNGYKVIPASTQKGKLPENTVTVWKDSYNTNIRFVQDRYRYVEFQKPKGHDQIYISGTVVNIENMNAFMDTYNQLHRYINNIYIK